MLAKEATHLIHLVTRFTEEIFSFLIACVFLTDALKKILYVMWLLVLCSLFNTIKLLFFVKVLQTKPNLQYTKVL
jgi:hypothetical protein